MNQPRQVKLVDNLAKPAGSPGRAPALTGPVVYQTIQARSILNRVKAMMPMKWTINPYRGCRHACVYCFARPTHTYFGLNAGTDFHSRIFVKINAPQLLKAELARPGWKGETVCLGSATDPYQPAERRFRLSRQILQAMCEASNPLEIITKSPLIVDDLDLLVELNRRTGGQVSVNMSLATLDQTTVRTIDPGAPAPNKRLEAVAKLSRAGIRTRLFIMPVLPGINDAGEELEALVRAASEAGASAVHADTLRIARGLEEYFYHFLKTSYPHLKPLYGRVYGYGRTTASDEYKLSLRQKMAEIKSRYSFLEPPGPGPATRMKPPVFEQSSLELRFEEPARLQAALEAAERRAERGKPAVNSPLNLPPRPLKLAEQAAFNW